MQQLKPQQVLSLLLNQSHWIMLLLLQKILNWLINPVKEHLLSNQNTGYVKPFTLLGDSALVIPNINLEDILCFLIQEDVTFYITLVESPRIYGGLI